MTPPTVRDYMSASIHTVGKQQTLATAHDLMRRYHVRHLPVLDHGKVVGLLSIGDLHLVETLPDVDPEQVTVDDAMTPEPYVVSPDTKLATAAAEMAQRKLGSVVVERAGHVVGVLTTTDALRALIDALERAAVRE